MGRLRSVVSAVVLALGAVGGVAVSATGAAAQDRCAAYADQMVQLNQQARQIGCPGWRGHGDWQGHYAWCQSRPPQAARGALETWRAEFDQCSARRGAWSGGGGGGWQGGSGMMRPPVVTRPQPPCHGISGLYGEGSTINVGRDGRSLQVMVSRKRPLAFGTCNGDRLTVNFPDDRVISGVFDGRTIFWDNRTTWTKR